MTVGKMSVAAVLALACGMVPLGARADPVNVVELTMSQIEAGLNSAQFTDQDLVQSYLSRIQTYNPYYNAFTWINPDAMAQAAAADAIIAANGGVVPGDLPMLGVPVVIKDSMNVAGVRTTGGFSGFTAENGGVDMIAATDAPIVARLKAAGAIILGKTNLPQFARTGSNANTSYLGPTYNTYNRDLLPGGSSTGTATAVSGSFAAIGTAEETGGSIQNPAGAQSLVGVKTTFGLVPTSGGIPLNGSTRDVFGVNARTVTDAANFLSVIAGYDASDPNTAKSLGHVPMTGYAANLSTNALAGKKIGLWSSDFKNVQLSAETQALYDKDVAILKAQGATVVENPFADPNLAQKFNTLASAPITTSKGTFTFSAYSGANEPYDLTQWLQTLDATKSPTSVQAFQTATGINLLAQNGVLLGSYTSTPGLSTSVTEPTVSQTELVDAFMQGRAKMLAAFEQVMADYGIDAFFFPQEYKELGPLFGGAYANTTVSEVNLMGTPEVDLPGGYYESGSPFSVAFLGDTFSEAELLSYAYDFEQATLFRTTPTLVPEPASLTMLGVGCMGLMMRRRKVG
jgi:Asp-tRNA(Asn)/Glu-tRNA(Gln) amidotransferase A subunit family amidase